MSVYILGMEMPTSCEDCPMCHSNAEYDYAYCCVSSAETSGNKIPSDCPLVPVPPHGRLIDASESIRVEFYDEEHEDWTRHDMTIDDLLSQSWVDADAPTIIPAEQSGKENKNGIHQNP